MTPTQATDTSSIPTSQTGLQVLAPLEVAAVAGGPEATVGTGLNPP